jgi:anti-sigma-K factor RskA
MAKALSHPLRDQLAAYALEALEPDEYRKVEAHLRTCAACRVRLRDYQAVSANLAAALPPQSPPPRVRAGLIARLHRPQRAPSRLGRGGDFARLAAGLALVALLALNLAHAIQLARLQRQQAAVQAQLQTEQIAIALLAQPEARRVTVSGQRASGSLLLASDQRTGVLIVWGLEALDRSHTYQIWLIRDDSSRVSAGLFQPEPGQSRSSVVLGSAELFSEFVGLGVTIEPDGGSLAPTGQRVLEASF